MQLGYALAPSPSANPLCWKLSSLARIFNEFGGWAPEVPLTSVELLKHHPNLLERTCDFIPWCPHDNIFTLPLCALLIQLLVLCTFQYSCSEHFDSIAGLYNCTFLIPWLFALYSLTPLASWSHGDGGGFEAGDHLPLQRNSVSIASPLFELKFCM